MDGKEVTKSEPPTSSRDVNLLFFELTSSNQYLPIDASNLQDNFESAQIPTINDNPNSQLPTTFNAIKNFVLEQDEEQTFLEEGGCEVKYEHLKRLLPGQAPGAMWLHNEVCFLTPFLKKKH